MYYAQFVQLRDFTKLEYSSLAVLILLSVQYFCKGKLALDQVTSHRTFIIVKEVEVCVLSPHFSYGSRIVSIVLITIKYDCGTKFVITISSRAPAS